MDSSKGRMSTLWTAVQSYTTDEELRRHRMARGEGFAGGRQVNLRNMVHFRDCSQFTQQNRNRNTTCYHIVESREY